MVSQASPRRHDQRLDRRLSIHFGSLAPLRSFLSLHQASEVCLKSIVSPPLAARSEVLRHYGVCVSACLYEQTGSPIAYATFLAGTVIQSGRTGKLSHPQLSASDPLHLLDATEAAQHLQQALFLALQTTLRPEICHLVLDAQWDVQNPWNAAAKGFVWQTGNWIASGSAESSVSVAR